MAHPLALVGGTLSTGVTNEVHALTLSAPHAEDDRPLATDGDGDGLVGCDGPDRWPRCTPECAPTVAALGRCDPMAPSSRRCGDGLCRSIETAAMCPADCP